MAQNQHQNQHQNQTDTRKAQPTAPPVDEKAGKCCEAVIRLPLAPKLPDGYRSKHVDLGSLSESNARALGRLRLGLMAAGAQLASGRMVATNADAIRYMLDQIK